ncbi:MAG: MFS transporter, partial [Bacteroidia bacterium]|nr:MFS transporter [Bacteroidia bacterium]
LADKFSPKKLMASSLLLTCAGGFAMSKIPSLTILTFLYGLWGLTTILLFWAAFIKSTRVLGGHENQGKSFGTVDAGRGFVAAALASISVLLFDFFLTSTADIASVDELAFALGKIIFLFSCLTTITAVIVWLFVPNTSESTESIHKQSIKNVKEVLKKRSVWVQSFIVLCAYVGYKCTDDFSLYASVVLGYDDVDAAHVGTISFWVRPFAAIAAGFIGDRFIHSKTIAVCFIIIVIGSGLISSGLINYSAEIFILITIASMSVGIYGLRGLYFALFEESGIPIYLTGSAVGVVSVLGYTPDIFMGPLMGYVLDNSPGITGHQHLFAILFVFAVVGFFISIYFNKKTQQKFS